MVKGKSLFMSIFHINLRSSYKNYGLLKAHMSNLNTRFDVIGITEAGVNDIDKKVQNAFPGYHFYYCKPKHKTTKGGTGVYIKNVLNEHTIERDDLCLNIPMVEDLWFEINKCIVGFIYKHPSCNDETFTASLERILDCVVQENKLCVLCGDTNFNLLNVNSSDVRNYSDVLLSHNFMPTITLPTRITDHSATLIDHINVFKPLSDISRVTVCGNIFFDISNIRFNTFNISDKTFYVIHYFFNWFFLTNIRFKRINICHCYII